MRHNLAIVPKIDPDFTHEDPDVHVRQVLNDPKFKEEMKKLRVKRRKAKRQQIVAEFNSGKRHVWKIRVPHQTWLRVWKMRPISCVAVWSCIAGYAAWGLDKKKVWGQCWPSHELISVSTGLSIDAIKVCIKKLVQAGFLDILARGTGFCGKGSSNTYMVHGLEYPDGKVR
jgi:hypothetical protein